MLPSGLNLSYAMVLVSTLFELASLRMSVKSVNISEESPCKLTFEV